MMAGAPYKSKTCLQPPSKGEKTVALNIVAVIAPKDQATFMRAFVKPRCFPLNQTVVTLGTILGTIATARPNKNIVAAMLTKLSDSPLRAPNTPHRRQITTRVRFTPNRSASNPPGRPTKTPAKGSIPQIVPTATMLKPKSNDISLKRTGIHILSMPAVTAYVSMANDRIYHLSFDPLVLVIEKTFHRERSPIDSQDRL
jgi:hypothetical protein